MEKVVWLKTTILAVIFTVLSTQALALEEAPKVSLYEREYIEINGILNSLLLDGILLYGMTLGSDDIRVNLKVIDIKALSKFMEKMHKHEIFLEPKLKVHTEFELPGFVLISAKIKKR